MNGATVWKGENLVGRCSQQIWNETRQKCEGEKIAPRKILVAQSPLNSSCVIVTELKMKLLVQVGSSEKFEYSEFLSKFCSAKNKFL